MADVYAVIKTIMLHCEQFTFPDHAFYTDNDEQKLGTFAGILFKNNTAVPEYIWRLFVYSIHYRTFFEKTLLTGL